MQLWKKLRTSHPSNSFILKTNLNTVKKIFNVFVLLLLANIALAQAPQGIPYQAVARNSSGAILASTPISVRFTIRDSIATGAIKYRETHSVTTTAQGMFNVNVGQGTPVTGTFSGINWGTNAKFMQVEMDPAGGSSYIDMGTTQMMSVPYALYSGSLRLRVSTTGDTLYSGGGNFVLIPGISAANNPPYPGVIAGPSTVCVGSTITLTDSVSGGAWSSSNTAVATIGSTGIVTGGSAGTTIISYTVTNSFGSSYATKIVTVNPLPVAGTITGTATVCAGSTTALSNTTTGGSWSSAATGIATVGSTGVVTGVAAGTATISYTVTNGCGSAFATRVVTVSATPSAGPITGPNTVAVSTTIALSNTVTGGTWTSSNTSVATVGSAGVVLGVSAGTVLISYAVGGSCGPIYATYSVTVSSISLSVGTSYGGGVIFYILQTGDPGFVSGETHGLIAAPSDQSSGKKWGCYGMLVSGTSTALGTGAANTSIVSATCGSDNAASLSGGLVLNGYSDWYLPSINELNKLYINRASIGGFTTSFYWSSSDANSFNALLINFGAGTTSSLNKNDPHYVRAIRSF